MMKNDKELIVHETSNGEVAISGNSPVAMFQLAASQNMDLDKLDKMLELQEKWDKREARKAYINAMASFKADPPTLFKSSKVSYGNTNYNYASLDHVAGEINKSLSLHGMFASWSQAQSEGKISVTCKISHVGGHFEEAALVAGLDLSGGKNAIQALGSTITYLQRYTLLALTGLAAKGMDTDGNDRDGDVLTRTAAKKPDIPKAVIKKPEPAKVATETWEEFIARKQLSKTEVKELDDYIAESAKSLDMNAKDLKDNAANAGDLEDMLEAVMGGKKEDLAKTNWWDQTKHWSFRKKEELKDLISYGFGERMAESDVCQNNPGSNNTIKQALPETKNALIKRYDKLYGAGEFNKLIGK